MNPYLPAVNQKLRYAQLLLEQAGRHDDKHLNRALLQSVVAQLVQALRLYMAEIASNYHCAGTLVFTHPNDLVTALAEGKKHSAEANELQQLSGRHEGVINHILNGDEQLVALPKQAAMPSDDNAIAVMEVNDQQCLSAIDSVNIHRWLAAFYSLIQRHREAMVEY